MPDKSVVEVEVRMPVIPHRSYVVEGVGIAAWVELRLIDTRRAR